MLSRMLCLGATAVAIPCLVSAATLMPDPVLPSDLTVKIVEVGEITPLTTVSNRTNIASPVSIDGALYIVDQQGAIHRQSGGTSSVVFTLAQLPPGLEPVTRSGIINISAGTKPGEVFVAFTSATLPTGLAASSLPGPLPGVCCNPNEPVDDLYLGALGSRPAVEPINQVIYKFDASGATLSDPEPIAAFETVGRGHRGGGMLTLPNGKILFATGDALVFGLDGRFAPQDPDEHLSKLLLIDPTTGSYDVVAMGLRNTQSLSFADDSTKSHVVFADIGGFVAEEVNMVAVSDLLDTTVIENFGWGRNSDGEAREGTFYVEPGFARAGDSPAPSGVAPVPEAGFIQPFAQYGRLDPDAFVAVSGPVTSDVSFSRITSLFGDLVANGNLNGLFATLGAITGTDLPVYSVALKDAAGNIVTLREIAGGRPDPRFFRFPDGSAGVLLEGSGKYFRLTEVVTAVPSPATLLLLLSAVAALYGARSTRPAI